MKKNALEYASYAFDQGWNPLKRHVMLYGSITGELANRALNAIDFLENDSDTPINLFINSEGGEWIEGLAIYDRLMRCECKVVALGTGQVSSTASAILQAADERLLTANCRMLIHDGSESFSGSVTEFEEHARKAKDDRIKLYSIYALRSGADVGFWEQACAADRILWADEAVDLGLADKIIPTRKYFKV